MLDAATSATRLARAAALFDELIDAPVEQRSSLLAARCDGDHELRTLVAELIEADRRGLGDFLHPSLPPGTPVPTRIGRYRIVGEIGRGGAGVVYEAVQETPSRSVALKVLGAGCLAADAVRRFMHEAEILGALQHPGIAQIYEAGTAEAVGALGERVAVPFLAMELVRGETLARHADRFALDARARLELVARVCDAVQYAHQRGVIHRDLKPANILVVEDGSKGPRGQGAKGPRGQGAEDPSAAGAQALHNIDRASAPPLLTPRPLDPSAPASRQPKVLDFGIARATGDDFRTLTLRTEVGQLIGTVPYMSPEQLSGDPRQIDTRSDVYALGVVLYELLAGRLPHDVAGRTLTEAIRIVREQAPRPLGGVRPALRGEVETICAKALHHDREQRYQSAAALADDIRRFLTGEPIEARRDSAGYVLRKRLRQHWIAATVTAAFVLLLVGGLATSLTLWRRSVQAADRAGRSERQARQAEQEARVSLAASHLAQAREMRLRQQPGYTDESLELLRQAAVVRGSTLELRNEALATLAQTDLVTASVVPMPPGLRVRSSAFDGKTLVGNASPGDLFVIPDVDAPGGQYRIPAPEAGDDVGRAWISPGGRHFVAIFQKRFAHDRRLCIWDVQAQRWLWQYALPGRAAFVPFAFSPDGRSLAIVHVDGVVRVHNLGDGAVTQELAHGFRVNDLLYAGSAAAPVLILADAQRPRLAVWDLASDTFDEVALASTAAVLAQSRDGRWLAAGCADLRIYVYRLDPNGPNRLVGDGRAALGRPHAILSGHTAWLKRLFFSMGDGLLVSHADDSTTRFWDVTRGGERFAPLRNVEVLGADNERVVLPGPDGLELRRLRPSTVCRTLPAGGGDTAFVSEEQVAIGGHDGLALWNTRTGLQEARLTAHAVTGVCVLARGLLASTLQGGLMLWPIERTGGGARFGEPTTVWNRTALVNLCVTPDERIAFVSVGDDHIWRVPLDDPGAAALFVEQLGARAQSVSADGTRLAVGHWRGEEVGVYSVADGQRLLSFPAPEEVHDMAIATFARPSGGGELLIVATGVGYYFLDAETYSVRHTIPRGGWLPSLTPSADGSLAVITRDGGSPALIDLRTFATLADLTLPEPNGTVGAGAFNPGGTTLIMTTNSRPAFVWDLPALHRRLSAIGVSWTE